VCTSEPGVEFFSKENTVWTGHGFSESLANLAVELLIQAGYDAVFIEQKLEF